MLPLQWVQIWSLVGELRPPMLQSMSMKKRKYVPSIPTLLRVFIINGCWILSNVFSASIEMIIWFLSLILLMWSNHIDWFADIDPSSQPRINLGFPGDSDCKKSAHNVGDLGSIPGLGRSPGEANSYPLQYSCLENSMDRGAWQATGHGVATVRHYWATFTFRHLEDTWRFENLCSHTKMELIRCSKDFMSGYKCIPCTVSLGANTYNIQRELHHHLHHLQVHFLGKTEVT